MTPHLTNTEFFLGVILPLVGFGAMLAYIITHGPKDGDRKD
jgi:hypothetical protein